MNPKEIDYIIESLKPYNFKYDHDLLDKTIKHYSFEKCKKVLDNIITNTPRLSGINIIFELKEALKGVSPERNFKILNSPICEICESYGTITMKAFINEAWYEFAVACKCSAGARQAELHKLLQWNGRETQKHNGIKYILHDTYKYYLELEKGVYE
jgi:hypothetical protein